MQQKLSFDDFTRYEIDQLDVQCGPCNSWLGRLVPELWFKEACQRHDVDYAAGHTETDKYVADQKFRKRLNASAGKTSVWVRWFALWAARKYYAVVVTLGSKAFNYGDRYATRPEIFDQLRKK